MKIGFCKVLPTVLVPDLKVLEEWQYEACPWFKPRGLPIEPEDPRNSRKQDQNKQFTLKNNCSKPGQMDYSKPFTLDQPSRTLRDPTAEIPFTVPSLVKVIADWSQSFTERNQSFIKRCLSTQTSIYELPLCCVVLQGPHRKGIKGMLPNLHL